jgi:hypothetical protein
VNYPILFTSYRSLSPSMIWAVSGFALFIFMFLLFGAPVRTYILEHELSHMLIALLSGTKIRSVSFRTGNAHVKTGRVNLFIALVPYSLPLYALFVMLLLKLMKRLAQSSLLIEALYFLAGLTLSFHFIATIYYLQLDQPDMNRYGTFASLILVITWTLVILALILALMFEDVQVLLFFRESFADAGVIYRTVFRMIGTILSVFFS